MLVLDVGPGKDDPEYPRWLKENRGPVLVANAGPEWHARNPTRYLRSAADLRGELGQSGWGHLDEHGAFVPSGIEPFDPDYTHARGTAIGELRAQQRSQGLIDE
jgi:hypothetical protein